MSEITAAYSISSYGRRPPFSSFLPGVAGERGIPLWCFYVNRGQCIAGFGSRDKSHSIMEFSPAHTAYQRVQSTGFRTFVKVEGQLEEPFADGLGDMHIDENTLRLSWKNDAVGLSMDVCYFVVPNMEAGMLARRVVLTNLKPYTRSMEVLDGLAAIVPFGLSQHDLKMMCQTAKAWMMVEGSGDRLPYFRLRSSMADTTSVLPIEEGSFGAAASGGRLLAPIVDPTVIFGWDTAFVHPQRFAEQSLSSLLFSSQKTENELPCCFFGWEGELTAGASVRIDSLFGLSHGKDAFLPLVSQLLKEGLIAQKEQEAGVLLEPWLQAIHTQTADPLFDRYCRQSYIDNFLRGGVPHLFRHRNQKQLFYLFSRKHGDLERDYNDFVVTPEYASQGNGNFRDVLQNRRSDLRFCPDIGWEPLKPFAELIQADGYNPLVVQPVTYVLKNPAAFENRVPSSVFSMLQKPFTPGELMMALPRENDPLIAEILCASIPQVNASFGEGYWVDHWIYLMDMLESCLSIYPEKKTEILFDRCLRWRETQAVVLPLQQRCIRANGQWRQHFALDHERKAQVDHEWLEDTLGHAVQSTLFEKLFVLCALKYLTLDPAGEGVMMEAGKPGWYDALNGLPGLFGSSVPELLELWRTLHFLSESLKGDCPSLMLPAEMAQLVRAAYAISQKRIWTKAVEALEEYREATVFHVHPLASFSISEAAAVIRTLEANVKTLVDGLLSRSKGPVPTYFTNIPQDLSFAAFDHRPLPAFLEGSVHALRTPLSIRQKRAILEAVRTSPLFDPKLEMYKVSADLSSETPEIGRANAFSRGWLEHESIWLHMEYKYLLEMLKNGFYESFFRDFEKALIPFQPPQRYGRSVLENVSFLASSANPDPASHGRGFVARLSGATAEFLEMWQILFFGRQPFVLTDGKLSFTLSPALPKRLIPESGVVRAVFLGHTEVVYHFPAQEDIAPDTHIACAFRLTAHDGQEIVISSSCLEHETALAVREGRFRRIHVTVTRR